VAALATVYALLVGINAYPHSGGALDGCVNDVRLARALLDERFPAGELKVRTLVDSEATRAAVIAGFREHLGRAGRGDIALFWFSGHGSWMPVPAELPWAEPSGQCQTIVCHDSRRDGVPDLVDKELAVLVREVTERGAHLVSVQDCCHSQSGMRGNPRTRSLPPLMRMPAPELLLPELTAARVVPGEQNPRHVALAACRTYEYAHETTLDSQVHGAFTAALAQALTRLGGRATYREVLDAVRVNLEGGFPVQHPVLDGPADLEFLSGRRREPRSTVTLRFFRSAWEIDLGAVHGIAGPGTLLGVLESAPPREVRVTTVLAERSLVAPIGWAPDERTQYRMTLTRVPLPPVTAAVDGAPDVVARLVRALGSSPYVRVVAADPMLRVRAPSDDHIQISGGDGVPVEERGIREAVADLEHIARWTQLRTLGNPGSALHDAVRLEVVPARPGEQYLPDDGRPAYPGRTLHLTYSSTGAAPSVFVRMVNTTDLDLYCVLLNLTDTYRVHADLFPGEHLAAHRTTAAAKGRPIRLMLPPDRPAGPGATVTDWLLLLVTEEPFNAGHLTLPRLREASRGSHSAHPASGPAAGWAVSTVELITSIPRGEGGVTAGVTAPSPATP
jgi:caspase domain-containing protein